MTEKNTGEKLLYCSFCGKSQHEVRKLIAGPSVFICDECIELCNDIIREETKSALVSRKDGGVPTPQEICDVLKRVRASRKLHGRWVSAPADVEAFAAWLQRTKSSEMESFLVCREDDGAIVMSGACIAP